LIAFNEYLFNIHLSLRQVTNLNISLDSASGKNLIEHCMMLKEILKKQNVERTVFINQMGTFYYVLKCLQNPYILT